MVLSYLRAFVIQNPVDHTTGPTALRPVPTIVDAGQSDCQNAMITREGGNGEKVGGVGTVRSGRKVVRIGCMSGEWRVASDE